MSEDSSLPLTRAALLARLRFEQAMGLECVHPVLLQQAPVADAVPPAASTMTQGLIPPRAAAPIPNKPPAARVPAAAPPKPALEKMPTVPAGDSAERWRVLEARAMGCFACALSKGRTNVVFGCGNRSAKLVFVGEGPGFDEDQQGIPFVGKAGQFLNKIIGAMKITREEVYICNVVKCRPPENRQPLPDEIAACSPYLIEQLELIAPKVIVALGGPATKTLLNTTQGIMSIRGRWFSYKGIPVMPTYHPAFVLRSYTEENRRAVWEDMKKVMAKLAEE